jgi:hypothetical protein
MKTTNTKCNFPFFVFPKNCFEILGEVVRDTEQARHLKTNHEPSHKQLMFLGKVILDSLLIDA